MLLSIFGRLIMTSFLYFYVSFSTINKSYLTKG